MGRVQVGGDRVPPTSQHGGEDERALLIKPGSFPRLEGTQVSSSTVSNTFWGAKGGSREAGRSALMSGLNPVYARAVHEHIRLSP